MPSLISAGTSKECRSSPMFLAATAARSQGAPCSRLGDQARISCEAVATDIRPGRHARSFALDTCGISRRRLASGDSLNTKQLAQSPERVPSTAQATAQPSKKLVLGRKPPLDYLQTMSRLAKIHHDRTESRRRRALESARLVLEKARAQGLTIDVIGSLTSGGFGMHSDVDFFVHGDTDPARRVQVERLVATAFNGIGIPYDIVYASDLTQQRVQEFLNG